jgi:hypothetical protein
VIANVMASARTNFVSRLQLRSSQQAWWPGRQLLEMVLERVTTTLGMLALPEEAPQRSPPQVGA